MVTPIHTQIIIIYSERNHTMKKQIYFVLLLCLVLWYSQSMIAQLDSLPEFPSAREVKPKVVANVIKTSISYEYQYAIQNDTGAFQRIWQILIQIKTDTFSTLGPVDWHPSNINRINIKAVSWSSLDSSRDIASGSNLNGFTIKSIALPGIQTLYSMGFLENLPEGEFEFKPGTNDIFFNSVKKTTIGPVNPPSPFNGLNFIDTIKSYINQSRTLVWITNQPAANKYTTFFDSARAQFQRNSGRAAHLTLDAVLANVQNDSGIVLTSEAYALIRYNTEYLKSHLPTITVSDQLLTGWNMVSVPVEFSDPLKSNIYPEASTPAFAYNGAYIVKDTLSCGIGYWIKYPSVKNINYTGLKIDTTHVAVSAGWNLIGSVSQPIPITKICGVSTSSSYFAYNGSTYLVSDTIEPGKGYWIKVSDNGTLILGIDTLQQGSLNVVEPPPAPDSPSKPVLQSPANGATGQSISPTLAWYAVETAETYRLQVATDSNFYFVELDQENIVTMSYQVGPLLNNTKYYWRVKAYNGNGSSYWSDKRSFTTQSPANAPPTPILASPANGATNISTSPTLSWNSSTGATSYRLQVANNSGFSTLVFDNAAITATSKQVTALSYSTIYYWRVNASNNNGTSAWSSARSFTTQNAPSSDPCLPITSTAVLDEFTIIDANGNRQNLFVHNGGRGLHLGHPDYDLPPETPKGAFHARFKSGKFIEVIPPNKSVVKIPIKIKDVVLPITLQWKVQYGNKVQYWLIDQKKNQKRIQLNGSGNYNIDFASDNLIYIEAQASLPCETN